jgi:hypothetical protein
MVSAGGMIERVNSNVWARWRQLGADGGGGGGQRSKVARGHCYFLGWAMFLAQGQEARCFLKAYFC